MSCCILTSCEARSCLIRDVCILLVSFLLTLHNVGPSMPFLILFQDRFFHTPPCYTLRYSHHLTNAKHLRMKFIVTLECPIRGSRHIRRETKINYNSY